MLTVDWRAGCLIEAATLRGTCSAGLHNEAADTAGCEA